MARGRLDPGTAGRDVFRRQAKILLSEPDSCRRWNVKALHFFMSADRSSYWHRDRDTRGLRQNEGLRTQVCRSAGKTGPRQDAAPVAVSLAFAGAFARGISVPLLFLGCQRPRTPVKTGNVVLPFPENRQSGFFFVFFFVRS